MRADRLLSILLLLQARGRMSAAALASRLEVSRRTIYRDLEALSAAGVPVVTELGPNGGASLMEGWRTDVTGLTEQELSTLLAFSSSGPASDLGLGEDLGRATRKLAVAAGHGSPGSRFQDRVLIDINPWMSPRRVPAHLARLQDALWSDRRLSIRYRRGDGQVSERIVEPYGLIAKNGIWYVLAGGVAGLRTYRVSRVEDATVLDETFTRPAEFDLERAWASQTARAPRTDLVEVTVRGDPVTAAMFYRFAASHVREQRGDTAVLEFVAEEAAAAFIASFGGDVEVLDPVGVRKRLAEIAHELAGLYGIPEPVEGDSPRQGGT